MIATYNGEPINALYTSTCGGRTEDAEKIFKDAVPYLRARECAAEGATFDRFVIKTTRALAELRDEVNVPLARDVSILSRTTLASRTIVYRIRGWQAMQRRARFAIGWPMLLVWRESLRRLPVMMSIDRPHLRQHCRWQCLAKAEPARC